MIKFTTSEHLKRVKLPFSYFSSTAHLDFSADLLSRNDEEIVVMQDIYYPHEFPALFLPNKKENWENCSATFVTKEDIDKVKKHGIEIIICKEIGTEYFYETKHLTNPVGKFGQRIRQFERLHGSNCKILNKYPKKDVLDFYNEWKKQKNRDGDTFDESEKFFYFCTNNLDKYNIKQVYIELNKKLVGVAYGIKHHVGGWVGLHLKVNYKYKGLSRLLHHERAKMFGDEKIFTLGTGAKEAGITQFKEELGPTMKKEYFYVLTGGKK
jgi:hypothetical protein